MQSDKKADRKYTEGIKKESYSWPFWEEGMGHHSGNGLNHFEITALMTPIMTLVSGLYDQELPKWFPIYEPVSRQNEFEWMFSPWINQPSR